jgi:2-iminoacetate synthase
MVQAICAFRLMFPDVGLVLSTREAARLRDGLIPLGITLMSAGSHTEPGGYTGAGRDKLHLTEHGRIVDAPAAKAGDPQAKAAEQFNIADSRSPEEVALAIRRLGYDPVWKDWDSALAE